MKYPRRLLALFTLGITLAGCPSSPMPVGDSGLGRPCTNDAECNDGFDCTLDGCGVDAHCTNRPVDGLCTAPERCVVGVGCTTTRTCTMDAECADGHDCTVDSCGLGGVCVNMPLNALCSAPTPFCDRALGCTAGGDAGMPGCTSSTMCADSIDCTVDTCSPSGTCVHTTMDALCTETDARCDAVAGCYVPMPCDVDDDCQDGQFCNGRERCQAEFGCVPAAAPATCDDSNTCTTDVCDTDANMCLFDCVPAMIGSPACSSVPSCTVATAGCGGHFAVTADDAGVITQTCAEGMVDFDFSEVTFTNVGPGVALTVHPLSNLGGDLSDNTAPVCPMVDARAGVTGMCPEQYILRGMFTDDDTFVGTFQFNGGGGLCDLLSGCRTATTPITATRIP